MSKQPRVATDPELLKPIIEAVIFASEEPLSARALIRLLAGEKENEPAGDASVPLDFSAGGIEDSEEGAEGDLRSAMPAGIPVAGGLEDRGERIEDGEEGAEGDLRTAMPAGIPVARPSESAGDEEATTDEEPSEEINRTSIEGAETGDSVDGGEEAGTSGGADADREERAMKIEGDGADLADAMERIGERVSAGEFRPVDGTLDQVYLRALIDELNDEYLQSGRAFRIVEVAGGFQFATIREYGEFVAMLSKDKARRKLSPAALETLAIIAYRQPVSKPEVEAIRGVNCDQVLLNLMEKNLVAITGRSEAVGRPLLYGTTEDFLRSFGLKGIGDLPKLREIEELMEEDAYSAERAEVITVDENTDVAELEAQIGAAGYAAQEEEETEDRGSRMEDSEEGVEGDLRSAMPAGIPVAGQSELEDRGERVEDSEEVAGGDLRTAMPAGIPVAGPLDVGDGEERTEEKGEEENGSDTAAIPLADLPEPEHGTTDEGMAGMEEPDDHDDPTGEIAEEDDGTEKTLDVAVEASDEVAGDGSASESEGEIAEDISAG